MCGCRTTPGFSYNMKQISDPRSLSDRCDKDNYKAEFLPQQNKFVNSTICKVKGLFILSSADTHHNVFHPHVHDVFMNSDHCLPFSFSLGSSKVPIKTESLAADQCMFFCDESVIRSNGHF